MDGTKQQTLLKVARDTVEAVIKGKPNKAFQSDDPELNAHCGSFVTLKNHGRLRGCIGNFISDSPLIELVEEMAKASATSDPRFLADQISARELEQLDVIKKIYPSDANFLLVEVDDANRVYQELVDQKVITRNRDSLVRNNLRITIGAPEENKKLISALRII